MPSKIKSALAEKSGSRAALVRKYQEIYKDGAVWLRTSLLGRTRLACALAKRDISGGRLLDVGCGGGRLPIMAARQAREAVGIDPSSEAIGTAARLSQTLGLRNTRFDTSPLESFRDAAPYDVVTVMGVLEHVSDPATFVSLAARRLKPRGLLIIEVPSFQNFRGDAYMTLRSLFRLPMSLADRRQVFPQDVARWAGAAGLRTERTVGYLYELGWGSKGVRDMLQRTPAALRDAGSRPRGLAEFGAWMSRRLPANRALLDAWRGSGALRRIPRGIPAAPAGVPKALRAAFARYLTDDPKDDPFYSERAPYNLLGAGTMYFLRRSR